MALSTTAKNLANNLLLNPLGLHLDSLTAERSRMERISKLRARRLFDGEAYPVPGVFQTADPAPILAEIMKRAPAMEHLLTPECNAVGFNLHNSYYGSPDAEVLYTLMDIFRPSRFIEVGSGNSTLLARQAVQDFDLNTRIVSIDPEPRVKVERFVDDSLRMRVEDAPLETFTGLSGGDIVFIDSSHIVDTENDVVHMYLRVLPVLPTGVVVHIHDIFLPFEYPEEWVRTWRWNEQYLVQAMLAFGDAFEVLWAGHYWQRTVPDFASSFPYLGEGVAQSLWLRKR